MPSFDLECTTCGQRYQSHGCGHGMRSYCENCGQLLETSDRGQVLRTLLLSLSCLILLAPANLYPILRFSFQGQWSEGKIITGALLLIQQHSPIVGIMVLFTGVIAPVALHLMVSAACGFLLLGWFPRFTRQLWRLLFEFQEWGMIDVYLLALGVGAIKLLSMGSVEPRPALWVMLLFVLISGLCLGSLNPRAIWTELRAGMVRKQPPQSGSSTIACHHCGTVPEDSSEVTCEICEAPLHPFIIDDRRVWAYLIATLALYIPANVLPVMTMSLLGDTNSYTIIGGIMYLWNEGDFVPAIIVFCGSIIVPIAKISVLFLLLFSYRWNRFQKLQTRLFLIIKSLGRWSMVDVFVLAVLVALGQMGVVATIEPQAGAIAFCGVVVFTIFAANSFQPRWIWTQQGASRSTWNESYAHGT
jgi:paraquat-inducible protein A